MHSIILTHLGESIPLYIKDCVHQIRLWNSVNDVDIFIILDQEEGPFWKGLETYGVKLIHNTKLTPTAQHLAFRKNFSGNTTFRSGYWSHVKERFFYMEELMRDYSLTDVISMEYDIMLYMPLTTLVPALKAYTKNLSIVMDNETRGHPGFMYIPSEEAIHEFNFHIMQMIKSDLEDMQLLALYASRYSEKVSFLPVIPPTTTPRISLQGHMSANPSFLWAGASELGVLFDSLVIGQWVGGVDPRNSNGIPSLKFENEGALYSMKEYDFSWERCNGLWRPIMAGTPVATIHMHSKALYCFLSDRCDEPVGDYNIDTLLKSLLPN